MSATRLLYCSVCGSINASIDDVGTECICGDGVYQERTESNGMVMLPVDAVESLEDAWIKHQLNHESLQDTHDPHGAEAYAVRQLRAALAR